MLYYRSFTDDQGYTIVVARPRRNRGDEEFIAARLPIGEEAKTLEEIKTHLQEAPEDTAAE